MSEMLDNIEYLSRQVGAHPAGTEEEQVAATYIADYFQNVAGLPTEIEDIDVVRNANLPRIVCPVVSLVCVILAMLVPIASAVAFVLAVISCVVLGLEVTGTPILSRYFNSGVSQNVVAKYVPAVPDGRRSRKRRIIVVAHYDDTHVRRELSGSLASVLPMLNRVCTVCLAVVAVLLLIKLPLGEGTAAMVVSVLAIVAAVVAMVPAVFKILENASPYSEGANCNASGVAVMMETAARIGRGRISVEDADSARPVVHGYEDAYAAGVVPQGASLSYDFDTPPSQGSADGLSAAKAAIAAMTGKPVSDTAYAAAPVQPAPSEPAFAYGEPMENVAAGVAVAGAATVAGAAAVETAPAVAAEVAEAVAAPQFVVEEPKSAVPDWFRSAQQKARKSPQGQAPQRSRFMNTPAATGLMEGAQEPQLEQVPAEAAVEAAPVMPAELATPAEVAQVAAPVAEEPQVAAAVSRETQAPASVAAAAIPAVENTDPGKTVAFSMPAQDQQAAVPRVEAAPRRQVITLPDIDQSNIAPIQESAHQRSSLADAADGITHTRETALPSLVAADVNAKAPSIADLRAALPSASGIIGHVSDLTPEAETPAAPSREVAGSAGMTGAFAPVGAAIAAAAEQNSEDLFVDDADDSDFEDNYTETGAFAGPGYVEMPKSRFSRFFGKFRKDKKEDTTTAQQWLDVDESFDAREVGKQRGSWESFRQDEDVRADKGSNRALRNDAEYEDDFDDYDDSDEWGWRGGAFSSERMSIGRVDMSSGVAESGFDEVQPAADMEARVQAQEMDSIYQLYNPDLNTEVWFVALGADLVGSAGMSAFLKEHAQDLRGSMVIELEGLGAGELCMIESEGSLLKFSASSRMKRYLKKAQNATGVSFGTASMLWHDGASSLAASRGMQTLHLAGMEGSVPAHCAQASDVLENVDEAVLHENADFVMELLKSI